MPRYTRGSSRSEFWHVRSFQIDNQADPNRMRSISGNTLASAPKTKPSRSTTKLPLIPSTPGQKREHSNGSNSSDMPSAPNGGPLEGPRQAKKSRMSPGPNVLGSLKEAGRSVMTLLGDMEAKSPEKRRLAGKKQRTRLSMRATGKLVYTVGIKSIS